MDHGQGRAQGNQILDSKIARLRGCEINNNPKRRRKDRMSRKKIRWFEWGDEKPGYVTTWTVGANGSVVIGRRITLDEARRNGYEFECPFA